MGLLSGEFTEQDDILNQSKNNNPKTYKPNLAVDVGSSFIYGAEKGLFNLFSAGMRPFVGDEEADKGLARIDKQIKPTNQGTPGHLTSGVTEVLTAAAVTAPVGSTGLAAASVGLGTRASEHTKLTQEYKVDQDTADTISNISGVSMAALTFVPMSNVFKNTLTDYAVTVGATTAVGQALTYGQGDILERKGYEKQGDMYKDMATDPTAIGTNLILGTAFWGLGRALNNPKATPEQIKEAELQTNQVIDQALSDADKASIPNQPETAGDLLQHQDNINLAIEQVMKGEKVNISEATGGKLKTLEDVKNHIKANQKPQPTLEELTAKMKANISSRLASNQNNSSNVTAKPFTATGTQKAIYDEAIGAGLADSDARTIVALAHFESGGTFDPKVKNPKSSATGVFQFLSGTWKEEGGTKANRYDLDTQIKLGIKHTKSNIQYIKDKTGVVLSGSQIYIPHLLGRGGAEIVFKAMADNPNQAAVDVIRQFSKQPHKLMRINGIPKDATIGNAINFFTKKIDDLTTQHYGGTGSTHTTVFDNVTESNPIIEDVPIKPESSYEGTIDRLDLDTLPRVDDLFLSQHDINAFEQKVAWNEVVGDIRTEQLDFPSMVLDANGNLVPEADINLPNQIHTKIDDDLHKFLDELTETIELTPIPHTAKGVAVKNDVLNPTNQEFKPDNSIAIEWKERQRWEDNKYHKELTRSFKDKEGNTVQELQYRGSYVRRTVDSNNHQTKTIHVGKLNRSDFKDHKGNKELETALDRIFDEGRAFGYLSQIPKGQQTIDKLLANPDLVISSKRTGEDLTAQQWQQKLQREQDNIQLLARSMAALAKCALKQIP